MLKRLTLSVALVLTLGACQQQTPEPVPGELNATGEVLVTVNGQKITQPMLDATLELIPPQMREQLEQRGQIGQVQEQLVVGELLYREAIKQNLHKQPDVETAIALAARNTLADAVLDKAIESRTTAERIQKYYDEHAVQYAKPQAKLRVIVVGSMEAGEAVKAELAGGADFAAVAAAKSEDPRTKANGGDLGWMETRGLQGEMKSGVEGAEKGAVVGPFDGGGGRAVLFKVEDKRDSVPLSDVEEEIRQALQQEIAQEYIEEMKAAATITEAGATGAEVTVSPAAKADAKAGGKAAPAGGPPAADGHEGHADH